MEEDLRTLILAGAAVPQTVAWVARPQEAGMPAVVLTRVSNVPSYTNDGPDGLVFSRVQIDVFAETYSMAKAASRAVLSTVNGYAGTVGSTQFQMISIDGERDLFDGDNEAERVFRISSDIMIHHRSVQP